MAYRAQDRPGSDCVATVQEEVEVDIRHPKLTGVEHRKLDTTRLHMEFAAAVESLPARRDVSSNLHKAATLRGMPVDTNMFVIVESKAPGWLKGSEGVARRTPLEARYKETIGILRRGSKPLLL